MPTPPCKTLINPDELFASRDLRLKERRESGYPQLMRLCTDFDFSVMQLQRKIFSHLSRKIVPGTLEFVLATHDESTNYWYSVTPALPSLKMLNDYAKRYEIDLLHMHLFGDEDDDYNQFQEGGLY
ncbi:MAG TPA: hypothetical protein VLE50_02375 [Cellvibrio sp.]|jgi:hypothetical protein|nr:hypothetical protein [Cellvibrio sp.]